MDAIHVGYHIIFKEYGKLFIRKGYLKEKIDQLYDKMSEMREEKE